MAEFLLVSLSRYSQNNTQKKKKKTYLYLQLATWKSLILEL